MKKTKRKNNNNRKASSNTPLTNTYIQDTPIKPNYVSGIEGYVRKGQVLHAVKIMRDTNEMSLMQCKDIIDTYRETGNWDHFKHALYPKDLAIKIYWAMKNKKVFEETWTPSSVICIIDKVLRENE